MELETEGDISIDTIPDENIEINMIEFKLEDKQPDISANLFIFSTGNTSRDSSDIKVSNHKRVSSNITNYEINNISGELLKYKPSSVDMYIPR